MKKVMPIGMPGPLLLSRIDLNPNMDKNSHTQQVWNETTYQFHT